MSLYTMFTGPEMLEEIVRYISCLFNCIIVLFVIGVALSVFWNKLVLDSHLLLTVLLLVMCILRLGLIFLSKHELHLRFPKDEISRLQQLVQKEKKATGRIEVAW